jgi:hypothetical protein
MYWPKRLRYQVAALLAAHTLATLGWMIDSPAPMWALLLWLVFGYAAVAWGAWRLSRR